MNYTIDENIDRRSKRTKKAIKSAFTNLAKNKDISKITVTEIAKIADINRKTFYAYYYDVYDVIDELENDLLEKLHHLLDGKDIRELINNPYHLFYNLTSLINEDCGLYSIFLNSEYFGKTLDKIKLILSNKLYSVYSKNNNIKNEENILYTIDFVTAGLLYSYKKWFYSDRKISLEEFSKQISQIVSNGAGLVVKEIFKK